MFFEKLKNYNVLLASNSKRRHELLNQLGVEFKIINKDIDESFSNELKSSAITDYLAKKKWFTYNIWHYSLAQKYCSW